MKYKDFLLFFLIILIASILRFWNLNLPDITEDERHYIEDSFRLFNKDPYISIRYHPFKHPYPSIGHSFLNQISSSFIFSTFAPTVFSARLVSAISGVLIVVVIGLFNIGFKRRIALFASFLYALLPFSVYFNRNAYLDSLFTLLITTSVIFVWKFQQSSQPFLLLMAGIFSGLAMSTKLNGIVSLVIVTLMCLYFTRESFLKKRAFFLITLLFPAFITFFLFNDPLAYLDGIFNPSDPAFKFSINKTNSILGIERIKNFFFINLLLLTPAVLVLLIPAIASLKKNKIYFTFFVLWLVPLFSIFITHGFDGLGAYAWLPIMPPLILILS